MLSHPEDLFIQIPVRFYSKLSKGTRSLKLFTLGFVSNLL